MFHVNKFQAGGQKHRKDKASREESYHLQKFFPFYSFKIFMILTTHLLTWSLNHLFVELSTSFLFFVIQLCL